MKFRDQFQQRLNLRVTQEADRLYWKYRHIKKAFEPMHIMPMGDGSYMASGTPNELQNIFRIHWNSQLYLRKNS